MRRGRSSCAWRPCRRRAGWGRSSSELAGTTELDEFTKGTLSEIARDEAFLLAVDDYLHRTRVLH